MSEAMLKDRRDQRREAILEVARAVFVEEGYAAASMSSIAARLGGSKGTLYNYFKSKEDLFAAYIRDECSRSADVMFDTTDDGGNIEARLSSLGERFLSHVLSETAVRNYQLVVSEAHRTPELAQAFYEAGPALGLLRLTSLLEDARERGEIEAEDCEVAAMQFMVLCRGNLHFRYSLNLIGLPTEAEIKATVDEGLRTFMARYGRVGTCCA
jgi:AcrR family transcriptional regulator